MSKDTMKKLKKAGGVIAAALAAFAITVLCGAILMERGTVSTDSAKAVLVAALVLCALTAFAVWKRLMANHTKRRKK